MNARDWIAATAKATPEQRQSVARVIGTSNPYALAPFTAVKTGEGWRLAACLSPPPHLDPARMSAWQPDGDVCLIDATTGGATLAGHLGGSILGDIDTAAASVTLYGNGLTWARAWAAKRAAWLDLHRCASIPGLPLFEPQDHALPGMLIAGPIATVVDWRPLQGRRHVIAETPLIARQIGQALLRAARIPTIDAMASAMIEAA